jgi:hypothetical protein
MQFLEEGLFLLFSRPVFLTLIIMPETNPFETLQPDIIILPKVTAELTKQGIAGSRATMIQSAFEPMVTMLHAFEAEFEAIVNKPINASTIKEAKELRLKMVKVRTGADKIHKEQKAEFLRGGRAVDGIKNILEFAVVEKEEKLAAIENHFINQEKERKKKLFDDRVAIIIPFIGDEAKLIPLGEMSEDAFNNLASGYRLNHQMKKKAAEEEVAKAKRDAEAKEIEQQKLIEENKKLIKYNSRLTQLTNLGASVFGDNISLADGLGGHAGIEPDMVGLVSDEVFEKVLNEFRDAQKSLTRVTLEKKQAEETERLATEAKLKAEKAAREKLEREKKEKEAKEEAERKRQEQQERKARRAPDKTKLEVFAGEIALLKCEELKDPEAQKILTNAIGLLSKVQKYITENAQNL